MTIPALAVGLTAVSLGLGAPSAQAAGAANMKSPLFAGFAALPGASATTAGVTFKVPTLSACTATTTAVSSGAAIAFTGTPAKLWAAGIAMECKSGKAVYEGVITIANVTTNLVAVKPGDTIVVTASLAATKGSATFADGTHKFSKSGAGGKATYALDGMGAVPIATGSKTDFPIPNFGKLTYTGGTLNGKTPATAPGAAVDMVVGATTKIVTSALGTGGATWTETWKHA